MEEGQDNQVVSNQLLRVAFTLPIFAYLLVIHCPTCVLTSPPTIFSTFRKVVSLQAFFLLFYLNPGQPRTLLQLKLFGILTIIFFSPNILL
jgi:hypothetical protein